MWGWILLLLSWFWMYQNYEHPTKPIEEKFVIKTFEKSVCKDDTDETHVWRTVESVQVD